MSSGARAMSIIFYSRTVLPELSLVFPFPLTKIEFLDMIIIDIEKV